MRIIYLINNILLFVFVASFSSVMAKSDVAGHSDLPKVKGSVLIAEDRSDYAEGVFFVADDKNKKKLIERFEEGKSTRLIYLLANGQKPLFALRNYQEAFSKLGDVTELFSCKSGRCPRKTATRYVWAKGKGRRIKTDSNSVDLNKLYSYSQFHDEQLYWFATIKSENGTYAVSVYSAVRSNTKKKVKGIGAEQGVIHVQIIENTKFESDLEYVKASDIQSGIKKSGHIALSGLFFDTGSDQLTTESAPALEEVAKALKESTDLKLYVVGHTDNVGSIASNQSLSARRAKSVAANLVKDYGIASNRFVSIGVGLAAPVTSNKTEEGRALNRRVELVER